MKNSMVFKIAYSFLLTFCLLFKYTLSEANIYIREIVSTDKNRIQVSKVEASYEGFTNVNVKGFNFHHLEGLNLKVRIVMLDHNKPVTWNNADQINSAGATLETSTFFEETIRYRQTVCGEFDYMCIWTQTNTFFTTEQIGTYLPTIPSEERTNLKKGVLYIVYEDPVSRLQNVMTCRQYSKCIIDYDIKFTPLIRQVFPNRIAAGQEVNIMVDFLYGRNANWLYDFKIGKHLCGPIYENVNHLFWWNNISIICTAGNPDAEEITNFMVQTKHGYPTKTPSVNNYPITENPKDASENIPFMFRIHPKIDSVSFKKGFSSGGQIVTLKGKAFNQMSKVFIGAKNYPENKPEPENECEIISNSGEEIVCKTSKLSKTIPVANMYSSPGVRSRLALNRSVNSVINTIDNWSQDMTRLEIGDFYNESPRLNNNEGFFIPKYTGYYKFYCASDDACKIYLKGPNDTTSKLILDRGWSSYMDFYSSTIYSSKFIAMNKNEKWELIVNQDNTGGPGYFNVGLEICEAETPLDTNLNEITECENHNPSSITTRRLVEEAIIPNKQRQVIRLQVRAKELKRLIYSFDLPLNTNFRIQCGDKTQAMNYSKNNQGAIISNPSANTMNSFLRSNLFDNLKIRRKSITNEGFHAGKRIMTDNSLSNIVNDSTNQNDVNPIFPLYVDASVATSAGLTATESMKLEEFFNSNKEDAVEQKIRYYVVYNTDKNTVDDIDKPIKVLGQQCQIQQLNSDNTFSTVKVTKIQSPSESIYGGFKIKKAGSSNITSAAWNVGSTDLNLMLNLNPDFTGKVLITDSWLRNPDYVVFHLIFNENTEVNIEDVSGLSLMEGKGVVEISNIIKFNKNFFFTSIPTEFLRTKFNTQTVDLVQKEIAQIGLVSFDKFGQEIESVCDSTITSNCDFRVIDSSTYPKVIEIVSFNSQTNAVSIKLSAALGKIGNLINNEVDEDLTANIELGTGECSTVPELLTNNIYSCILTNLTPGNFEPRLKTQYGYLENDLTNSSIKNIDLLMQFTNMSPTTLNPNGGELVTITGKLFPNNTITKILSKPNQLNQLVKIGDDFCLVKEVSTTQIKCLSVPVTNMDNKTVVISYNSKNVELPDAVLYSENAAYLEITNADLQNYLTFTPSNKIIKNLNLKYVKITDNVSEDIIFNYNDWDILGSDSSLEIVHLEDPSYFIPIGLISPISREENDSFLKFAFPGGKGGDYFFKLTLKHKGTNSKISLKDKVILKIVLPDITNISPTTGSPQGGTILTITGTNFANTNMDQHVYVGARECKLLSASFTEIKCVTKALSFDEYDLIDAELTVRMQLMIQFDATCSHAGNCKFKYSSDKFVKLAKLTSNGTRPTRITQDSVFNISGLNLDKLFDNTNGEKTLTFYDDLFYNIEDKRDPAIKSQDAPQPESETKNFYTKRILSAKLFEVKVTDITPKSITCTVINDSFNKYGSFYLNLHSNFASAIFNFEDSNLDVKKVYSDSKLKMNIFETVAKPTNVIINPQQVSELGGIIKFNSDSSLYSSSSNNYFMLNNGINCEILSSAIFSSSANEYNCIASQRNAAIENTQLVYKENLFDYSSFNNVVSKISSANSFLVNSIKLTFNKGLPNESVSGNIIEAATHTVKISSSDNDNMFEIVVLTQKVTEQTRPSLYLLLNNKHKIKHTSFSESFTVNAIEYSRFVFSDLTFPAGMVNIKIIAAFTDQFSFSRLNSTTRTNVDIEAELIVDNTEQIVTSPFVGGAMFSINSSNLYNELATSSEEIGSIWYQKALNSVKVKVCGIDANILQTSTSKKIMINTPKILVKDQFINHYTLKDHLESITDSEYKDIVEYYTTGNVSQLSLVNDDDTLTNYRTKSTTDFVGLRIKTEYVTKGFRFILKYAKIYPGQNAKRTDFKGITLSGWDGTVNAEKTFVTNNNSLDVQWEVLDVEAGDEIIPLQQAKITFTRANLDIGEIRFVGKVININTGNFNCDVNLIYNEKYSFKYTEDKITYDLVNFIKVDRLSKVNSEDSYSPLSSQNVNTFYGTAAGGDVLVYELNRLPVDTTASDIKFRIYGNFAEVTKIVNGDSTKKILYVTTGQKNVPVTDKIRNNPIEINIKGYGDVYVTNNQIYYYRDRWSSRNTWGGEFVPKNGETVFIENTDIILDMNDIKLNGLFIENGSLFVYDNIGDIKISTKYLIVNRGNLQIGTETDRFEDANFTLNFIGSRDDLSIPLFGNKVLGTFEGNLDVHGKERSVVWTQLSQNSLAGSNQFVLADAVDWEVDEYIVVAPSDHDPTHSEKVKIINVSEDKKTITFTPKLKWSHSGVIEELPLLTGMTVKDTIDLRAEVILLSRNIKFTTDESSYRTEYGWHQLHTASHKNMEKTVEARFSYVEMERGGQAFQLGTYPIHFHMIGDNAKSYVKGCSIHDAFNRAITIHATNKLLIENNVMYNVRGHTLFVEDSVERYNRIINNVIISTKASFSLLNVDFNPASFWITHPTNSYIGNHACGSTNYGFWFELPERPTGLHMSLQTFPRDEPLGEFRDNVSHSNGVYGLRIFPYFRPNQIQGDTSGSPLSQSAVFENQTSYANGQKGLMCEQVGDVEFRGFKTAQNRFANMDVSISAQYTRSENLVGRSDYITMPRIVNSFTVGYTANPAITTSTNWLVAVPRKDNFLLEDIRFYQQKHTEISAAIKTCSRCEISEASTDSGARTSFTNYLRFDNTITRRVFQVNPQRAILGDLDGSLVDNATSTKKSVFTADFLGNLFDLVPKYWVTQYAQHLDKDLHSCSSCVKQTTDKLQNQLVCSNTDNQQLRRFAFKNLRIWGDSSFNSLVKIRGYTGENVSSTTLDKPGTNTQELSKWTSYPYRQMEDPSGWAIPLVTGCKYLFAAGQTGVPVETSSVVIERNNRVARDRDRPVIIAFNYTNNISDYQVVYNSKDVANITTTQQFTQFNDLLTQDSITTTQSDINKVGANFHDLANKIFYLKLNSNNVAVSRDVSIKQWECPERKTSCPPPRPNEDAPKEEYNWSNANIWPNKIVPIDNQDVEIPMNWRIKVDVTTNKLKNLIIRGEVYYDKTMSDIGIQAQNILITDTGKLLLGTAEEPLTNNVHITLLGSGLFGHIALGSDVPNTFKSLAVLNQLRAYGENRAPYTTKLKKSVIGTKFAGNSNTIEVMDAGLKWRIGDEIAIGGPNEKLGEAEKFKINGISGNIITLNDTLKNNHTGHEESEVMSLNKAPFNLKASIDHRSVVMMLTRNIKIRGDTENANIGGNVIIGNIVYEEHFTNGTALLSHVEFQNMGKVESEIYGAILLVKSGGTYEGYKAQSNFTGLSFSHNNFIPIVIKDSSNVNIHDFVAYRPTYIGIRTDNSQNVNIFEGYIFDNFNRTKLAIETLKEKVDPNACYYLCEKGNCANSFYSSLHCYASETYGLLTFGNQCSMDYNKNNNPLTYSLKHRTSKILNSIEASGPNFNSDNSEFNFNVITSAKLGGVYWLEDSGLDCAKVGNYIVMNNHMTGIAGYPKINGDAEMENIVSVNNEFGVSFNTGTSRKSKEKRMKKITLIGATKYTNCLDLPGYQAGLLTSMTSSGAPTHPIKKKMLPLYIIDDVTTWASRLIINGLYLLNWEDKCQYDSFALRSNSNVTDSQSIVTINDLYAERVIGDNLWYADELNTRNIGDPCGDFPCTGPNTLLLHINNTIEWKAAATELKPEFQTKWLSPIDSTKKGSISFTAYSSIGDRYFKTNSPRDYSKLNLSKEQVEFRKEFITFYGPDFTSNQDRIQYVQLKENTWILPNIETEVTGYLIGCKSVFSWNAVLCGQSISKTCGVLNFEALDYEAAATINGQEVRKPIVKVEDLALAPVYVRNDVMGYTNKLNSYLDHGCVVGYPTHKRKPRYHAVMCPEESSAPYIITMKGSTPGYVEFQYLEGSKSQISKNVYLEIPYEGVRNILFFNKDKEVVRESADDKAVCNFSTDCCCSKKRDSTVYTFMINSKENCVCRLIEIASVKIGLLTTFANSNEVYVKQQTTSMRAIIMASLKLDPSQVRVSHVIKGAARRNLLDDNTKIYENIGDTFVLNDNYRFLQSNSTNSSESTTPVTTSSDKPIQADVEIIVLESNPQNKQNGVTSTAANINLNNLVEEFVQKIGNGDIKFNSKVERITIVKAEPPSLDQIKGTNSTNSTNSTKQDPIIIKVTDSDVNTTTPVISETDIDIPEDTSIIKEEKKSGVWYWYIIMIGCFVVVAGLAVAIYFLYFKKSQSTTIDYKGNEQKIMNPGVNNEYQSVKVESKSEI